MINDYGAINKNIGESGANIIKGNAEIMISPEAVAPDLTLAVLSMVMVDQSQAYLTSVYYAQVLSLES
ncbi:MAG: hypothetical protein AB8V06_02610 [Francisella endosymbiont of Hyalomma asiaticum]